ncbi:GNAT family N-acetyltransferase [Haloactinopolyspora sp.]|uniref:GNAT family N-acetyltransferase n=1 Tax=Haloactinopolyspora sp. TaxID=1966353 RepID=UPI00262A40B1|nr:GNAT family N-acetyltransferase [Haloactinopolyspora sp.]
MRFDASKVLPDIKAGHAFVVRDGGNIIATAILTPHGDRDFWTHAELAQPAFYVAKVATLGGHTGIGAAVLDWCGRQAAREGADLLRLDAWRTNTRLHHYYVSQGFSHVRTVTLAHRNSGALFERPAKDITTDAMHQHQVTNDLPTEQEHTSLR